MKEKVSNPNNKMLILCSQHNPVGRVWTKEGIEKIIDICVENDLYLVSDEIHCDLIRKENTFTSTGIFKDKIKEKWIDEIMNKMAVSNPTPFVISATKAAYTRGE